MEDVLEILGISVEDSDINDFKSLLLALPPLKHKLSPLYIERSDLNSLLCFCLGVHIQYDVVGTLSVCMVKFYIYLLQFQICS